MSGLRIGSLCSGYGGLEMGVQAAIGGSTAWVSDIDKGACKILAHRFPDIPNLRDFTTVDWADVEPVDVLAAGFPCQPVSNAGKQLGDEDERWLWDDVLRAVRSLGPRLVVLENVRGLLTAGSGRLFGRVLGTLADSGYDASWRGIRAADVGAPHGRFRVFIVATNAGSQARDLWTGLRTDDTTGNGGRLTARVGGPALFPTPRATDGTKGGPGQRGSSGDLMLPSAVALLPTPTVQDGSNDGGPSQFDRHSVPLNAVAHLLPTPAVNDMDEGKTVEAWDDWTAKMKAAHGNGNGHGASLSIEAQRLLATPTASVADGGPPQDSAGKRDLRLDLVEHREGRWGQYAAAIARWEQALGRPAPAPTMTSSKGNPQLSPAFVEWLMGLPAGWVDDVPGLTRNEKLKALGNGVVWQQATAALADMLTWQAAA